CGLLGRGLLRLLVAMIVVMIVVVVMVMIVVMMMVVIMLIGIGVREEFFTADHLVGHGCQFGDEVHHLVFKDRSAQFLNSLRVLLEELIELTFLTGELAGTLSQRLVQFLLRHGDRVLLTDFGQHEAEAHATFRNLAVFGADFLFRLVQISKRLVLVL